MEKTNYMELARRVGDCVMMNNLMPELECDYDFELFCGDNTTCITHYDRCKDKEFEKIIDASCDCGSDTCGVCDFESKEIYQYYAITQGGAEYLKRHTNEIVYYCDKLNVYLWAITHFGTPWNGVDVDIKE